MVAFSAPVCGDGGSGLETFAAFSAPVCDVSNSW